MRTRVSPRGGWAFLPGTPQEEEPPRPPPSGCSSWAYHVGQSLFLLLPRPPPSGRPPPPLGGRAPPLVPAGGEWLHWGPDALSLGQHCGRLAQCLALAVPAGEGLNRGARVPEGLLPSRPGRPHGRGPPAAAQGGGARPPGRAAEGWGVSLDTPGILSPGSRSRDRDPGPRRRRPAATHRQARLPLLLALRADALLLSAFCLPLLLRGWGRKAAVTGTDLSPREDLTAFAAASECPLAPGPAGWTPPCAGR